MKQIANSLRYAAGVRSILNVSLREAKDYQEFKPPTFEETQEVLSYLKSFDLQPVIVGSAAVVSHLQLGEEEIESKFRTTNDLDVVVSGKLPSPAPGWSIDPASEGVVSWISPSGGSVDFLFRGQNLPDGRSVPKNINPIEESNSIPIADLTSIFKMKLDSYREKDLRDLAALVKKTGVPQLSGLTSHQKENLEYVKLVAAA